MKTKFLKRVLWLMIPLLTIFSGNVWGAAGDEVDEVANIISGKSYYIKGVRTNGTVEYLSFTDAIGTTVAGTSVSSTSSAIALKFTYESSNWYITTPNGYYVTPAASNGKLIVTSTKTSVTLTDHSTEYLIKIQGASYYLQKNKTGTNFGGYNNTQNDVTLIQAPNAAKYTVTFSTGTGNPSVANRTESSIDGGITLPSVTPACSGDGWALYGWATSACGSSTTTVPEIVGKSGDTYYPDKNITLYAVYRKLNTGSTSTTYTINGNWTSANGNWTKVEGSDLSYVNSKYGLTSGYSVATSPRTYSDITSIVFSGSKSGAGAGTVEFYVNSGSGWTSLGSKSIANSLTWSPSNINGSLKIAFTRTNGYIYIASIQVTYKTYDYISAPTCTPACSAPAAPTISGTAAYTIGQTITLTATCASGADASTTYTWYKGANWATASGTTPVQAAATGSSGYTFTKTAVAGDAGTYWCEASNGSGCEAHNSTGKAITVSCVAPTSVSISGTNKYLGGQTIDLTATPSGGAGDATYQWQKKISGTWTNLSNGTVSGVTTSGATTSNLKISSCTHENSGGYRCIVTKGGSCSTKSHADGTDGYGVHVFSLHGKYTTDGGYSDHEITWTSGTTGTKTLHLSAKKTYLFKVWSNNGYYYGHGANANEDFMFQPTTWDCGVDNREMRLFTTVEGDYTFTVNIEHGLDGTPYVNVQVGYPSMTHPNSGYVYVQKFGWRPYLHYWYNNDNVLSAWGSDPQLNAEQYTTICGTDYWCVPVIDYYCNFIAKDAAGDPGNTTGDQHTNSPHPGQRLYNNGSWNWGTFTTYSITYAGNGNTGGSMTSETDICPNADKALTPNAFSKADHTFQHWTADVDVKIGGATVTAGNAISDGATIQDIQSDIALTAQWRHVPVITVSETARAFGDRAVSGSYTMTFTVSGTYLQSDLSIARTSGSTYFTVDKATVTQTDGTAPTTTITVTYAPAAAGSHSATLTISSTNATSKTVALSGTGKWEVTWNNNGSTSTTLVANSTKPTFPSTPGSCDGTSTTFIGWATAAWTGKLPSLAGKTVHTSNSTMDAVTTNGTTYYAVFAAGTGTPSDEWQLVTNANQLNEGDKIVFANGSSSTVSLMGYQVDTYEEDGVTPKSRNRKNATSTETVSSSKITLTSSEIASSTGDAAKPYVLTLGKNGDYWTLYDDVYGGYLYAASPATTAGTGEKNWIYYRASDSDAASRWSISVSGTATILSQRTTSNRVYLKFNSGISSCYQSTTDGTTYGYIFRNLSTISYSDYMTTCCNKQVTLSATVTGSVGGTVTFSPVSPIATCSATAAERKTTVTVTPATGYKLTGWTKAVSGISLPDSTSAISTSSGNAEVQTNTYTFAQNDNGSMSVTATFTMMVDHYIDRLHNKTGYTGDGMVKNTVGYTIPNPGDASAPADDSCIEAHYKFIGWIAEEYVDTDGTLLDASKLFTASGTKNPSDTNFLAVWAKEE